MSLRRVSHGTAHPYEVRVQILGQPVLLGYFPLRSQATLAEDVATKSRKALSQLKVTKRKARTE
jgi:hypothetical protein